MATATKTLVTAEEFDGMSFPARAELVRGEVLEMTNPGPLHGMICVNVLQKLLAWSPQGVNGVFLSNDARVQTRRDPDSVRGPDVMFVSKDRVPSGGWTDRSLQIAPDLAVEIFPPSDRWRDVHDKINDYLTAGVREVWVLHPRRQMVDVFRPDEAPVTLAADAELTTDVLPGFRCEVGEFFAGL